MLEKSQVFEKLTVVIPKKWRVEPPVDIFKNSIQKLESNVHWMHRYTVFGTVDFLSGCVHLIIAFFFSH